MKLIPKLTLLSQEHWTYDPFSAHKTENGDIYARGTQVCKLHLTKIINIINPFAPGDFAQKRVLKLVEWFSGHCRAIKS